MTDENLFLVRLLLDDPAPKGVEGKIYSNASIRAAWDKTEIEHLKAAAKFLERPHFTATETYSLKQQVRVHNENYWLRLWNALIDKRTI